MNSSKPSTNDVDLYSASAIVKVLDALNPQNKEKYLALDPLSMAEMAMKMMKEVKLEEYGVGMKQKTQYGVSGSGYGDAKPAAPAQPQTATVAQPKTATVAADV
mgnify:CR=1 FL=1